MLTICVFGGPSLPQEDRIAHAGVEYLPPASRGDVSAAAETHDTVLLIDGVFHHDLAPSPKEVYEASRRARVFGASSMGALRAAECAPYGVLPVGIIARWYLNEVIDGDDEVAVLVDPATQRALTVPSVNVRYVAWLARRQNVLTGAEGIELVERAREIFYADRSWTEVLKCLPRRVRARVEEVARRYGDLKRHDAKFALRRVLRTLAA